MKYVFIIGISIVVLIVIFLSLRFLYRAYKILSLGTKATVFTKYGFKNYNFVDITNLAMDVSKKGKKYEIPTEAGCAYYRMNISDKIDFWAVMTPENKIGCIAAYFIGSNRNKVKLESIIPNDVCKYEGYFYAWAGAKEDDPEYDGDCPFVFECPGFLLHKSEKIPDIREVSISVPADKVMLYADEKNFDEESKKIKMPISPQSFFPTGTMNQRDEKREKPVPDAFFAGIVKNHKLIENSLTGEKFYCLTVETYGMTVDVFIPEGELEKTPSVGNIALVFTSEITGYFLDEESEDKSGHAE
ncbi:MAG: hypothetical protein M1269_09405 [Chloroflexi bacterium]|nr:hypothetical protein [Chloroflexota bacterium]